MTGRSSDVGPVRLQLSRRAGFDLQHVSHHRNGLPAVNVARPSRWGNPFVNGAASHCGVPFSEGPLTPARSVDLFRRLCEGQCRDYPQRFEELRGRNLACWCEPGQPCHADVLLEFANCSTCEALPPEAADVDTVPRTVPTG